MNSESVEKKVVKPEWRYGGKDSSGLPFMFFSNKNKTAVVSIKENDKTAFYAGNIYADFNNADKCKILDTFYSLYISHMKRWCEDSLS